MRTPFLDSNENYIIDNRNLRQMPYEDRDSNSSQNYLGDADAAREWASKKELAKHMFLHTDAYHKFLNDSSLILLGRTGTGKTAILCSIEENARNHIDPYIPCSYVIKIDCEELLINLASCNEFSMLSPAFMSIKTKKIISMFIYISVMREIVARYGKSTDNKDDNIKIIEIFLKTNNFVVRGGHNKSLISLFLDITKNVKTGIQSVDVSANIVFSILDTINVLLKNGFDDAVDALENFLINKENVLVLVDSLNEYNINNCELVLIVKALIESCFAFYNSPDKKILVKIALPSEIYNRVLIKLPGKNQGNTVIIKWKYKELVTLLALRIFACYKNSIIKGFSFCDNYNYDSFYADINENAYINSMQLLSNILPHLCPTSLSYKFLTLAYCLRHTLKKPREVLYLFNVIIDVITQNNCNTYFIDNPNEIRNILHSTQKYMTSSALSMYASTYPIIYTACRDLLQNSEFIFTGKSIKQKIKSSIQVAKKEQLHNLSAAEYVANNELMFDEVEITRILLESGLIGEIVKKSFVKENSKDFENQNPLCILSANFEYRVAPFQYIFTDKTQYVLHPMCYEQYCCWVDDDTLVYPDGLEDEGDIVINTIILNNI